MKSLKIFLLISLMLNAVLLSLGQYYLGLGMDASLKGGKVINVKVIYDNFYIPVLVLTNVILIFFVLLLLDFIRFKNEEKKEDIEF